jgi:hypothetical protein
LAHIDVRARSALRMHQAGSRGDAGADTRVIWHRLIFRCARNHDCAATRKNNLLYGTLKLWPDTSTTSRMGRRQ